MDTLATPELGSDAPSPLEQSFRQHHDSHDSTRDMSTSGLHPQQRIRAGLLSRVAAESAEEKRHIATPSDEDEAHMSDTGQIPRRFDSSPSGSPINRSNSTRSPYASTPSPLSSPANSVHPTDLGRRSMHPQSNTSSLQSSTSSLAHMPSARPGEGNHPYTFSGDENQSDASAHSGAQYASDNLSRAKSVSSVSSANSTSSLEATPFRAAPLGNVRAGFKGYGRSDRVIQPQIQSSVSQDVGGSHQGSSSGDTFPLSPARQRVMPKPASDLWQYRNAPGMGGRKEGRPLPGSYGGSGPSTMAYTASGGFPSVSPSRRAGSTIRSKIVKSANKLGLKPLTVLPTAQPSEGFISTRVPLADDDMNHAVRFDARVGQGDDPSLMGTKGASPTDTSADDAGAIGLFKSTTEDSHSAGPSKSSSLQVPTSPILSNLGFNVPTVLPGKSATPPPSMARTSCVTNAPLFVAKQPAAQSVNGTPGISPLPSPSLVPRAGFAFGKWARGVPSPGTDVLKSPQLKCSPREERELDGIAPLDGEGRSAVPAEQPPFGQVTAQDTLTQVSAARPASLHALPPTPEGGSAAPSLHEDRESLVEVDATPRRPRPIGYDDIVGRARSLSPSRPSMSLPPSPRSASPDIARTPAQQVRLEARAGRARAPSEPSGSTPGPTPGVAVTGLPSSEASPVPSSRSQLGAHLRSLSHQHTPSSRTLQQQVNSAMSVQQTRGFSRLAADVASSSRASNSSAGSGGGSGGSNQTVKTPAEELQPPSSPRGRRTPRPSLLRAITSEVVFSRSNSSQPGSPKRSSFSDKQGSWGRGSRPSTSPSSAASSGGEAEAFPGQRLLPASLGGRRSSRSGSTSSAKGASIGRVLDDKSAKSSPSSPIDEAFRIKWPAPLVREAQGDYEVLQSGGSAARSETPAEALVKERGDFDKPSLAARGMPVPELALSSADLDESVLSPVSEVSDSDVVLSDAAPMMSHNSTGSSTQSTRPQLAAIQQMPREDDAVSQQQEALPSAADARLPSVAVSESESLAPVSFRDPAPAIAGKGMPPTVTPLAPLTAPKASDPSVSQTFQSDAANHAVRAPLLQPAAPSTPLTRSVSPGPGITRSTRGPRDFEFGEILGEGSYSTVIEAWDLVSGPSKDDPKSAPMQTISAAAAVAGASAKASAVSMAARQGRKAYAIKVLDKVHILKERKHKYVTVEKEALSLLIRHPGIVTLYWTFQDRESLYFVLELAQNGELLSFIKRYGSFDVTSARFYSAQLLEAIHAMHKVGVIHRDIKPENVLLDAALRVKVTDFGSAKIVRPDATPPTEAAASSTATPTREKTNSFVGTAEYVSPELLGGNSATASSDFWAFGCVLFQMIAGRPPFKGPNEYQTFQKILKREFQFPDEFPNDARDLVDQLLVLDPLQRLGSGPSGASEIKRHPFFQGVQWDTLWNVTPPPLQTGLFQRPPTAANLERHFEDMNFDFCDSEGDGQGESVGENADLSEEEPHSVDGKASEDGVVVGGQAHVRRASSVSDSPADEKSGASQAEDADDSDSSIDGDGESETSGSRPRVMSNGGMGKRSGNLLRFAAAAVTGRDWPAATGSTKGKASTSRRGSASQPPTTLRQIQRRFSSSGPNANASTSSIDEPDASGGIVGLGANSKRKSSNIVLESTSSWTGLLLPHEVLLYSCPVVHRKTGTANMFSKRRQLLLTDFPRLLCVKETAAALKVKSEVILAIPGVDSKAVLGPDSGNLSASESSALPENGDASNAGALRAPFSVPMRRGSTTDTIFSLNSHLRAESLSVATQRPSASRSASGNAVAVADESFRPPALMPSWARSESWSSNGGGLQGDRQNDTSRRNLAGVEDPFPRSSTVRPAAPSMAATAAATPNLLTGLELKPGGRVFVVETPSREYVYEDLTGDASHWVRSIMSAAKGSGPSDGPYISHV